MAETRKDPAIDDLEFPPPCCPECDQECGYDGSWCCTLCNIVWAQDGTLGERQP